MYEGHKRMMQFSIARMVSQVRDNVQVNTSILQLLLHPMLGVVDMKLRLHSLKQCLRFSWKMKS